MTSPPLPAQDLLDVRERVGPLWARLAGARLLLTGCTGFFGPWLLETLLEANHALGLGVETWVLTRDPNRFRVRLPHLADQPALRLLEGDVRTFRDPGVAFTHVVHGAASSDSTRDPQDADATRETILGGTGRILDLACRQGAPRFLFLSSGARYGVQPPLVEAIPEDHPGQPEEGYAYGVAKAEAEELCLQAFRERGLPVVLARCFAFLAPHLPLNAHFAAGNFLADALVGRPLLIKGDGRPVRTYLYGSDLAWWLWTMLLQGRAGRAYNVGSEVPVSIAGLARAVAAPAGLPVTIALPPGAGAPPRYVPCTARAREELGLRQTVDLAGAIEKTLGWLGAGPAQVLSDLP